MESKSITSPTKSPKKSKKKKGQEISDEAVLPEVIPFIKKWKWDSLPPAKNNNLLICPVQSCKCSFYIPNPNKEYSLLICPKGHNICGQCFSCSHFPISCATLKTWENSEFSSFQEEIKRDCKKFDCPLCGEDIKESELTNLTKNTRHLCAKCNRFFCYFCMEEWKINNRGWGSDIHHCKEVMVKGKYNKKAKEFFEEFEKFKKNYLAYQKEKIQMEENLMKMKEHFESIDYKNSYEAEIASKACSFYESYIDAKNCLFLGKEFSLFIKKEKLKKNILEIIQEMEEIFMSIALFNEKSFDSYNFYLKKFEAAYQNMIYSSALIDLKKLIQRIGENLSSKSFC